MASESRRIPSWAQNERAHDIAWIGENLYILWPAAREGFERLGRGAILVDTTSRPTGAGNPFIYAHERMVEEMKDDDTLRMVRVYDGMCQAL
jgi:hypothetical protein